MTHLLTLWRKTTTSTPSPCCGAWRIYSKNWRTCWLPMAFGKRIFPRAKRGGGPVPSCKMFWQDERPGHVPAHAFHSTSCRCTLGRDREVLSVWRRVPAVLPLTSLLGFPAPTGGTFRAKGYGCHSSCNAPSKLKETMENAALGEEAEGVNLEVVLALTYSHEASWLFTHVRSIASGTIRSAMPFQESFTKCCDAIGRKQDACAGFLASWCSIGGYRLVFNAPLTLWFEGICLLVWAIKSARWGDFSVFVSKLFQSPTRYQVLHITYYPLTPLRLFLHVFGHADWKHFFGNTTSLLLVLPMLEEKYKVRWLVCISAINALTASTVYICFKENTAVLGASGIVFQCMLLAVFSGR
eukprot:s71_g1.t4